MRPRAESFFMLDEHGLSILELLESRFEALFLLGERTLITMGFGEIHEAHTHFSERERLADKISRTG